MNNKIIALAGFSSAGKDTLAKFMSEELGYDFVVSHTTRPMRPGESEGNPYYFINDNEMCSLAINNKLVEAREYDSIYGKWFYAVSKDEINDDKKYIVVVDINGYKQLKDYFGDRVIGIFIESSEPERRARAIASRADFNIDEWNRRFKDDIKKFPQNLINKYFKLKFKNKDIENSKDLLKAISKKFDEGVI